MTEWVLDEALQQCRRWIDAAGPGDPTGLSIAVNLSTRSLLDASLVDTVREALVPMGRAPPPRSISRSPRRSS